MPPAALIKGFLFFFHSWLLSSISQPITFRWQQAHNPPSSRLQAQVAGGQGCSDRSHSHTWLQVSSRGGCSRLDAAPGSVQPSCRLHSCHPRVQPCGEKHNLSLPGGCKSSSTSRAVACSSAMLLGVKALSFLYLKAK